MNFKIITLAAGMAAFMFTACDSGHSHSDADHQHDDHAHHDHADHDHGDLDGHEHGDLEGDLRLNNGEKWIVNAEMKPHVLNGEKALSTYLSSGDTDYLALASKIEDANSNLISSCTMKGTSHDELHKWLHPHLVLIVELEEAQNQEEADQIIADIQDSYETYHNFFN